MKSKAQSMLIICFDIKGIVDNEFVLLVQMVNFACYFNILWCLHEK
jgi:hypothetical protein